MVAFKVLISVLLSAVLCFGLAAVGAAKSLCGSTKLTHTTRCSGIFLPSTAGPIVTDPASPKSIGHQNLLSSYTRTLALFLSF
jgi:hypothetical protein